MACNCKRTSSSKPTPVVRRQSPSSNGNKRGGRIIKREIR